MAENVRPLILNELCNGCGVCVEVCSSHALKIVGDVAVFAPAVECAFCGECEAACPTEAIRREFTIVFEPAES